jgi:hypothetical protein
MAAACTQQYAAWLQKRHRVQAPAWGLSRPGDGTCVHVVGQGGGGRSPDSGYPNNLVALGPRVHVVGDGHPSTQQDKNALLAIGPRVHVVDGSPDNLKKVSP